MGLIIHLKAHGNRPLYLLRAIRRRQPRLPRALRDCRAQGFMLDYFRASAVDAGSRGCRTAVDRPQPAGEIWVPSSGVGEWLRPASPLLATVAAGDALPRASHQAASTFLAPLVRLFPSEWACRLVA